MALLEIDSKNSIYFEFIPPKTDGVTFVFVNPLTGSTDTWSGVISDQFVGNRNGFLVFDFRGQGNSQFCSNKFLDTNLIVSDLIRLTLHLKPQNPILVGLSIGGLYAALAIEKGLESKGLVMVNTLRKTNLRLEWINRTMVNVARYGGTALLMDFNMPMIAGHNFLEKMMPKALKPENYLPLDTESGIFKLLEGSLSADWNFDWSKITLPTLVMTGHLDRVFRIEEDIDALALKIPNVTRVEMPDHGHLIPLEAPDLFLSEIINFGKKVLKK